MHGGDSGAPAPAAQCCLDLFSAPVGATSIPRLVKIASASWCTTFRRINPTRHFPLDPNIARWGPHWITNLAGSEVPGWGIWLYSRSRSFAKPYLFFAIHTSRFEAQAKFPQKTASSPDPWRLPFFSFKSNSSEKVKQSVSRLWNHFLLIKNNTIALKFFQSSMAVAFNREPTWLFMNWIFESQTERWKGLGRSRHCTDGLHVKYMLRESVHRMGQWLCLYSTFVYSQNSGNSAYLPLRSRR